MANVTIMINGSGNEQAAVFSANNRALQQRKPDAHLIFTYDGLAIKRPLGAPNTAVASVYLESQAKERFRSEQQSHFTTVLVQIFVSSAAHSQQQLEIRIIDHVAKKVSNRVGDAGT
jgi:hypothetical protein